MTDQKPKPLLIRLPPDLKAWLETEAQKHHRTQNGQVNFILEEARKQQEQGNEN